MKKSTCLILLLICGNVFANQSESYNAQSTADCLAITELAESANYARQNRVPITEMYKTLANQDPDVRRIAKILIDSAYEIPLAKSKDEAELVILEYTNRFFSECIKDKTK